MAISPIQSSATAVLSQAAYVPQQPVNREVASAVQALNQNGSAGSGRAFSIAIDAKSKVPVVRIVDSHTNEVIEQIPSQYVLDLAQQIDRETASTANQNSR